MTEIEEIGKHLSEGINYLAKMAASREQETDQLITKHYQDVVLQNIDVRCKEINGESVIAWAQVRPEYFAQNKPRLRNNRRTNTFWGVDVCKWLCDLWKRDYPDKYFNECYTLKIDPKTGDFKA